MWLTSQALRVAASERLKGLPHGRCGQGMGSGPGGTVSLAMGSRA